MQHHQLPESRRSQNGTRHRPKWLPITRERAAPYVRDLTSVDQLMAWYNALDAELEAAVAGLSEEDVKTRQIDRGGWSLPPTIQLEVYKEALLIFYGKASVYLKAMGKPRPQQWQEWIA